MCLSRVLGFGNSGLQISRIYLSIHACMHTSMPTHISTYVLTCVHTYYNMAAVLQVLVVSDHCVIEVFDGILRLPRGDPTP